jgi:RNA polymerase sigma-70 factor (ECF subfamily)
VGTWIYSIARNVCLTAISRRAARPPVELREAAQESQAAAPTCEVLGLVEQLPEKYRQVVMLYYMEDKSYEEVARVLNLPIGTVKTYLHRARKQLVTLAQEAQHGAMH